MRKPRFLALAVFGLLVLSAPARADVKPNPLFSDNMVLQQGVRVPVWGTADDGEQVTVTLQGQEVKTTAKDGKWMVQLDKLKAGGPFEMVIAGKNKLDRKNVLVGEVWIASGQSNMEWSVNASADPDKVKANADAPRIRFFVVPNVPAEKPVTEVQAQWQECTPAVVGGFSAVAYHFARALEKALDVPVGVIQSDWGGTRAEAWTSRAVLEADPAYKNEYVSNPQAKENYARALEKYKDDLEAHKKAVEKAKAEGKTPPSAPRAPVDPARNPNAASVLYNGMIAPLIPYAIQGAIWYQGESNAGKAFAYRTLFPTMIKNWRDDWKQGDFTFLFVQLAPFAPTAGMKDGKPVRDRDGVFWAELREAQLLTTQKLPKAGMAVITDVGDEVDIHPKQKQPVGERLALAAQAIAYGKNVVYSGPVYDSMKVEDGKAVLTFKHIGGGLVAKGGDLQGFSIAGEDRKFVPAQAEIRDDKVVVWSKDVARPAAVRYGWANYPVVNLYNKDGLPATPFRTDDFPLTTAPMAPKAAAALGR